MLSPPKGDRVKPRHPSFTPPLVASIQVSEALKVLIGRETITQQDPLHQYPGSGIPGAGVEIRRKYRNKSSDGGKHHRLDGMFSVLRLIPYP